jgi:hypothetical protein
MEVVFADCLPRVFKFAAESMIGRALQWLHGFCRRQLLGLWVQNLGVPLRRGVLQEDPSLFLKSSAFYSLRTFFAGRSAGGTVFWAPGCAGKTYTLSRMELRNSADRRYVYVDFAKMDAKDSKAVFYGLLGLDAKTDIKPLGTYLHAGVFFTFIFDHFDTIDTPWISTLLDDSILSSSFNVLLLLKDPRRALALLKACGHHDTHTRLLGPPYCGRWFATDLEGYADPQYNDLVDQCGLLAPMISIRNSVRAQWDPLMQVRVAKAQEEWEMGEQLLREYRGYEV